MRDGKMKREMDRQFGPLSVVMQVLYQTSVVKKEPSSKANLSVYQSVYLLSLAYGHELWVVTKRTTLKIYAAEMRFLFRVAGLSFGAKLKHLVGSELSSYSLARNGAS